ncbi:HNH endonuclease signature motif containing protein [Kutzneria kofuensis]
MKEFAHVSAGGTCTAPGCASPIQELDHITPWPAGHTTPANLQGLCTWHHHRKHDNYTATRDPDGTSHWTTPTGRHYTTRPFEY